MFSHIITFGSSLPEARGGHSLYAIICERVLMCLILVFVAYAASGVAQDKDTDAEPDELPVQRSADVPLSQTPDEKDAQNPIGNTEKDKWRPRFQVTLHTKENGLPGKTQRTVEVPIYETAYEDREVAVYEPGKTSERKLITQRVAVRKLAYRKETVTVWERGSATLLCDELSVSIAKSDTSNYGFECSGRLYIRIGGLILDADSGSHKDGVLQLTNVTISQQETRATASSLSVPLQVLGLATADFDKPVSNLVPFQPQPYDQFMKEETRALRPMPDSGFPDENVPNRAQPDPGLPDPFRDANEFDLGVGARHFPAMDPLPTIIR
jgi:hypothetical protein